MVATSPARRTADQQWRLAARIGLATLTPAFVGAVLLMLDHCVPDGCLDRPRALSYLAWWAFGVSTGAGLFASFSPQRFYWSQRARPPVTLVHWAAQLTSVGAVLAIRL
ncbi:hypothetical protein [Streptomyces albipurpureus]|uniref:Uncharacterized protein n=1 Tax=Streptomyces albipurpureus TaxID=2897419 RepID=A0ABT0V1U0_9ACTN|nr:hypothetical protein [Streptomyces sp. CWNU-1]MCM2393356.1 hypothetical protein [Streptomyces sp. CWNU-1]